MGTELDILNWLQNFRTPAGDFFMVFFTYLGNFGIVWILMTAVLLIIPSKRKCGAAMAIALVLELILCNLILKNLVMRVRPCDVNTAIQLIVARPWDYSFPSGHTASSFAAVTVLALRKEKWMALGSLVLAILISFSRMYLYVHFPTDVAGGFMAGVLCGFIGFLIVWGIERKRGKKHENL